MNKNDSTMHHVQDDQTPLRKFQRDPRFKKMYEEAHIEVISQLYTIIRCIYTSTRVNVHLR